MWEYLDNSRWSTGGMGTTFNMISIPSYESFMNIHGIEGFKRLRLMRVLHSMDLFRMKLIQEDGEKENKIKENREIREAAEQEALADV